MDKEIFGKKILIFSLTAFLIPMFPVLLYDINHDFPQTLDLRPGWAIEF